MTGAMPFAALLLAALTAPESVAGLYQSQQMEVGAALELQKSGHFRYQLSYGAIDEKGEGDWSLDGKAIYLTSKPMPKEPNFELISDKPAAKCRLSLSVDWGRFSWNSAPDVLVTYQGTPKELHFLQADEDGNVHLADCAVTSVLPIVPMFDIPGAPVQLASGTGHELSLRFVPNDLGHVAFRAEAVKLDGSELLLERYGAEIRFIRVDP